MKFVSLITFLLCAVAHAAPGPLIVTAGGTYASATYTTVSVRTTAPVTLDRLTLIGPGDVITSNTRPSLTVTNCTISTTAPHYACVLWRVSRFVFEHNALIGTGGVVIMDSSISTVHIRYNSALNISGVISPTQRDKTSAFQLDEIHCGDIDIAWNAITNHPGVSAVEDCISFAKSGGTSASPAQIHDNFVDGAFQYPHKGNFSGSGIMCWDPGSAGGAAASVGGYTKCSNNIVIAVENAGIDVAGSHNVELASNVVVNDGTTTQTTTVGIRTWRWIGPGGGTPLSAFGPFNAHDNRSCWYRGTRRCDFDFAQPQTASVNNVADTDTDAGQRLAWAAKVKAAGVVIGPVPLATSTVQALSYVAASPEVQAVPLPKEHLGSPVAIGYTVAGSWVKYSALDFGSGVKSFTASQATILAGQSFTVHLDAVYGPLVATVACPKVSSWYAWNKVTALAIGSGTHDVYLLFGGSINLASFSLK